LDKGYASLKRTWKRGDTIDLDLPMPVRRIVANEKIADDIGKVALQRGPLVYCVEWPDVKDGHVVNLLLPDDAPLRAEFQEHRLLATTQPVRLASASRSTPVPSESHDDIFGGLEVVRGQAVSLRYADAHKKIEKDKVEFTAIPYYAWANRGRGEMAVWLAHTETEARPLPFPTIASTSKATASNEGVRPDVRALNDQREPKSSGDHGNRYLHWWPHKGTKEWVQYDFAKPTKVSAVEVYWFDDTGVGECRLPKSWNLSYRSNGEWKPVANPSEFGCAADKYNRTTFDPVETDALRLEVQLPERFSTGIHEWHVEDAK
jgi:hypothetical protein